MPSDDHADDSSPSDDRADGSKPFEDLDGDPLPFDGTANDSLKGSLILADPSLREPTFFQSVLLLTEHSSENGALGYILNRPLGKQVGDLLGRDVLSDEQRSHLEGVSVFLGGPVNTEHLTFSALGWSEGLSSGDDEKLQYSTHLSAAEATRYKIEGFHIRAYVGYSGWEEGQLEREMQEKSWIAHRADRGIIDDDNLDDLWKSLLREHGPYYRFIADEPDDLSLN